MNPMSLLNARLLKWLSPALLKLARASAAAAFSGKIGVGVRPSGLFVVMEPTAKGGTALVVGEMHHFSRIITTIGATEGQALIVAGGKLDAGPDPSGIRPGVS